MIKTLRNYFLAAAALFILMVTPAAGQSFGNDSDSVSELLSRPNIQAIIQSNNSVQVEKNIVFDASASWHANPDEPLRFSWDLGDNHTATTEQVIHSYSEPGSYVVNLKITDSRGHISEATQSVTVYKRKFLLITDNESEKDRVEHLINYSNEQSVFVDVISKYDTTTDFLSEEELAINLVESIERMQNTDLIVVWTKGSSGLTVFSQLKESFEAANIDFSQKKIIYVSDLNLKSSKNIAQGVFNSVGPNQILLTRPESLWPVVDAEDFETMMNIISERGIEFHTVDSHARVTIFNFMSFFINYLLEKGVPSNSLLLILMLPIIVTVIAFIKQVVGLTTLGVYTPAILTLTFIALGLKFGLLILFMIVAFGTATRYFLRHYKLQYIPRMAIVLTVVSIVILFLLLGGALLNSTKLLTISVFPMLIMVTLVEKFVSIQSGKGFKRAIILIGETVLVAIVCYMIAEWSLLKILILGTPELIFITLLINVGLAKWTGLRLSEYFRFREIFKHVEE